MNDAEYIAAIAEFYKDGPSPEFRAHYERLTHISAAIAAAPAQAEAPAGVEAVGEMRASELLGVAPYADIWSWLQPGTKLYSATQVQAMLAAQAATAKQSPHPEYDKGFSDGWNRCEERQAARYRWLRINAIGAFRTNDGKGPVSVYHLSKIPAIPGIPEETDAAIDAAIAAQQRDTP